MKQNILIAIGLIFTGTFVAGIWQVTRLQQEIDDIGSRVNALPEIQQPTQQLVAAPSDNSQLTEDVREIGSAVKLLSEQLDKLSARLNNSIGNSFGAEETTLPQAGTETKNKPPRLSPEEQIVVFENTLNDATVYDETWSTTTTAKVEELVNSAPEYQIADSVNVQCGGTLCMVDALLPVGASQSEKDLFEVKLTMDLAADLPRASMLSKREPDGSTKYIFYMARTGYKLPTEGGASGLSQLEANGVEEN